MGSLADFLKRPVETYHFDTYDRISKNNGFDGKGKTILITGGASGVGLSMAHRFAAAGVARVAIISRSADAQEKAKAELQAAYPSTEILAYQASITDNTRMEEILNELKTIDVLILGAALAHGRAKAVEVTETQMHDAFETNTIAPFNITKAYMKTAMPASGRKTVINVSAAAIQIYNGRASYGTSKAAGVQVMQHFASDYKEADGVRIFSVHPGTFYTPGVAEHIPQHALKWENINLPADFSLWLASDESAFLHGRFVWANWDVDELIALKDRLAKDPNFLTVGLIQ